MRHYSVEFEQASITTANGDYDLFEFVPATNRSIELCGLILAVTSELGDAQEEQLRIKVIRGHATSGDGTATTPAPLNNGDGASGFTAETVGATIASTGTPVDLHSDAFNVRTGYQFWWPDGFGPTCTVAGSRLVVRMMSTVTDDLNMSGTAYIREI